MYQLSNETVNLKYPESILRKFDNKCAINLNGKAPHTPPPSITGISKKNFTGNLENRNC